MTMSSAWVEDITLADRGLAMCFASQQKGGDCPPRV